MDTLELMRLNTHVRVHTSAYTQDGPTGEANGMGDRSARGRFTDTRNSFARAMSAAPNLAPSGSEVEKKSSVGVQCSDVISFGVQCMSGFCQEVPVGTCCTPMPFLPPPLPPVPQPYFVDGQASAPKQTPIQSAYTALVHLNMSHTNTHIHTHTQTTYTHTHTHKNNHNHTRAHIHAHTHTYKYM
jgi:hypothetical protein